MKTFLKILLYASITAVLILAVLAMVNSYKSSDKEFQYMKIFVESNREKGQFQTYNNDYEYMVRIIYLEDVVIVEFKNGPEYSFDRSAVTVWPKLESEIK